MTMRVSPVLGSGGARGYAHIGVIDELLARGHKIVAVSGSSIGALIGGAYAAGKLENFREACLKLNRLDVFRMMTPTIGKPGIIKTDKIMAFLEDIIGEYQIEDLAIPYCAVAADVLARREVWFRSGPLLAAIRASISIPSVFKPVMLDGRLLADGGLLNPLPMESSLRPDADLTVAVALFGKDSLLSNLQQRENEAGKRNAKGKSKKSSSPFDPLPDDLDLLKMTLLSLDLMQDRIQASRIAVNPPDIYIDVPASLGTTFDFAKAEEFIAYGQELAVTAFDRAGI